MALLYISYVICGFLGILLHCLIEMNKINKQLNGEFKLRPYLRIERFNIAISFVAVITSVVCASLIKKMMSAEYYLCPAYVCIGYFGQSILIAAFGKAAKFVQALTGQEIEVERGIKISTKDECGLT